MKMNLARLLASLVIDQWPIPQWLRRRLQAYPEIARAIENARGLENHLRNSAGETLPSPDIYRVRPKEGSWSSVRRFTVAVCVSAAAITLSLGVWNSMGTVQQNDDEVVASAGDVDLKPVLATLSAGETVAMRVSSGLKNVSGQLVQASDQLGLHFARELFKGPSGSTGLN